MSYKILEQNGIDNENIDGGAFNNFAAGGRDGIVGGVLSECTITATGSVVAIAPGLLMIHGIRVKIEEIETIAIMSVPLRPTSYQLVGQVIVSSKNNVEFSAFIRSPQELAQSNFYTSGEGTYQVELASFVHNPDGSISDLVRTVDIIYGGAGGGTNIEVGNVVTETLPAETDAEFDVTVRNPAGTNKTLLDFTAKIPKGASGTDEGAVHFNEMQSLSEQQKAQARENIDAASTSGMHPNMSVGYASAASCDENGNNIDSTYAKQNGSYPNLTAGMATKATQDGNGANIVNTYAKQTGTYSGMTVGTATKATQDGNGNNIANTYGRKAYLHRIQLDLSNEFHLCFDLVDYNSSEITKNNLTQRLYAKYNTRDIVASGFVVEQSHAHGSVYAVHAESNGGKFVVSAMHFEGNNVMGGSYAYSTSNIGVSDYITEI